MTNEPFDCETADAARYRARLTQIAALLGEPEAAFFDSSVDCKSRETAEMLHLWDSLANAADRRKLLALARSLAPRAARDRHA